MRREHWLLGRSDFLIIKVLWEFTWIEPRHLDTKQGLGTQNTLRFGEEFSFLANRVCSIWLTERQVHCVARGWGVSMGKH